MDVGFLRMPEIGSGAQASLAMVEVRLSAFTIGNFSYLGTGWSGGNTRFGDFWKYDPTGDKWEQVASLPQGAERSSAVGFSVDGMGYCGTGYDGSKYLNDFYKFDPAANTWTKLNA